MNTQISSNFMSDSDCSCVPGSNKNGSQDITLPVTNKCRCCLQAGELKDVLQDNHYMEMFKQTLNVSLCTDSRLPQLLCSGCMKSIKEAKMFRDMVMATETRLLQALTNTCDDAAPTDTTQPVLNVWIKEEKVVDSDDNTGDDTTPPSGDLKGPTNPDNLVIVPDVKIMLSNFPQKLDPSGSSPIITPLKTEKKTYQDRHVKRIVDRNILPSIKRLTCTTKLRQNIILIMQYSSIVPFRHNSKYLSDYICYFCENSYEEMKKLAEHTESQHVGKVNDETILTLMRTRAHKLINADISCVKCRLCLEDVKTIQNLIHHLVKVHEKVYHKTGDKSHGILGFDLGTEELKCHLCNEKFDSFKLLNSHMNGHYKAYECVDCQQKFARLLQYRAHLKTHEGRKDLKCDHCGVTCNTKTGLEFHMKRKHLNVALKCELCPVVFRFKEYRKRDEHMATVHGKPKPKNKIIYTCDICKNEKVFSSNHTLKIHKSNVHKIGDLLRIQCEMCDFVAHDKRRMRIHMDLHNGVKGYACDLCGKKFNKPNMLRIHMKMHGNDKNYACNLCDAAFVHKIVLQMHMNKNHPDSDVTV